MNCKAFDKKVTVQRHAFLEVMHGQKISLNIDQLPKSYKTGINSIFIMRLLISSLIESLFQMISLYTSLTSHTS